MILKMVYQADLELNLAGIGAEKLTTTALRDFSQGALEIPSMAPFPVCF